MKAQGRANTMLTVEKLRVDDEDDKQKRKHGSHDDDPMRWELENYPFFRFFFHWAAAAAASFSPMMMRLCKH